MSLRSSAYGEFWGCSAFPRCKGKRSVAADDFELWKAEDEFSHIEDDLVEAEDNLDEVVFFSANVVDDSSMSTSKRAEVAKEQSDAAKRAQNLYDRATRLFGSRQAAVGWLTSKKVGLGHKTPVDVMQATIGCDLVEKLLGERFEKI